jgi:small subunit ribosomal protein S2
VRDTVANGGTILFVGTKKQAQEAIAEQAQRVGMPFINQRWLGGLLTNFQTVQGRLARLKELEVMDFDDPAKSGLTKKELLILRRERDKLEKSLGGIRTVTKTPSAMWVVDTNKEHLAITEAKKLGIPVIAILDTNCDPDEVTIGIPGNDDAIRSVALLTRVIADAVAEGTIARHTKSDTAAEPLAEWERELLEQSAPAAAAEAAAEPVVEAPVVEAPVVEAPVVEAPVVEAPVVEAPASVEEPAVEAPVVAEEVAVEEAPEAAAAPEEEAK